MKINIPCLPAFSDLALNAKSLETALAPVVIKELEQITPNAETSLVTICFKVDTKIKTVVGATVLLECIRRKFPEFSPKAMFINTVPSPAMVIEIEFGSFREMGGSL